MAVLSLDNMLYSLCGDYYKNTMIEYDVSTFWDTWGIERVW